MNYPEDLIHLPCLDEKDVRIETETNCMLGFLEWYAQIESAFLSDDEKNLLYSRYETSFSFPVTQVREFIRELKIQCDFVLRNGIDIPLLDELKQLTRRDNYSEVLTPKYFFTCEVLRNTVPDTVRNFIETQYLDFVRLYLEDITLSEIDPVYLDDITHS